MKRKKKNLKKIPNRGNAPSRSRCLPGIVFVLYIFCRAPSLSMSRRLLATGHPTPLCHPIDLISKSSGFYFFLPVEKVEGVCLRGNLMTRSHPHQQQSSVSLCHTRHLRFHIAEQYSLPTYVNFLNSHYDKEWNYSAC